VYSSIVEPSSAGGVVGESGDGSVTEGADGVDGVDDGVDGVDGALFFATGLDSPSHRMTMLFSAHR
jgi:hypothetical protein